MTKPFIFAAGQHFHTKLKFTNTDIDFKVFSCIHFTDKSVKYFGYVIKWLDFYFGYHLLLSQWMDDDIPKKVKANVEQHYSHQNLKVMEFINFTGTRREIEIVLHLVQIAASLEKLVIHVCVPNLFWPEGDILSYERNQYDKGCRCCVELLKTQIRPEIDVLASRGNMAT